MGERASSTFFCEVMARSSVMTEGAEFLNDVGYVHLESTEHHCDEQVVMCSISIAYSYVRTVNCEAWEQTNVLQIVVG